MRWVFFWTQWCTLLDLLSWVLQESPLFELFQISCYSWILNVNVLFVDRVSSQVCWLCGSSQTTLCELLWRCCFTSSNLPFSLPKLSCASFVFVDTLFKLKHCLTSPSYSNIWKKHFFKWQWKVLCGRTVFYRAYINIIIHLWYCFGFSKCSFWKNCGIDRGICIISYICKWICNYLK